VPGAAVALRSGLPVAVFEQQGKVLRVFGQDSLRDSIKVFAQEFHAKRIFPALRRLTVKQYPPEATEAFKLAGFEREMQDFVLYRNI
jgi:ATP-dependent Lhr-like helicase